MRDAFAVQKLLQKLLSFFSTKKMAYLKYLGLKFNFNEMLTNDVISFEQLGPCSRYLLPTEKDNV